jgi:hypothetical protein
VWSNNQYIYYLVTYVYKVYSSFWWTSVEKVQCCTVVSIKHQCIARKRSFRWKMVETTTIDPSKFKSHSVFLGLLAQRSAPSFFNSIGNRLWMRLKSIPSWQKDPKQRLSRFFPRISPLPENVGLMFSRWEDHQSIHIPLFFFRFLDTSMWCLCLVWGVGCVSYLRSGHHHHTNEIRQVVCWLICNHSYLISLARPSPLFLCCSPCLDGFFWQVMLSRQPRVMWTSSQ